MITILRLRKSKTFSRLASGILKNCNLKKRLLSAQPIAWQGCILSKSGSTWNEGDFHVSGEVLGGYYHILAENLDEAITIAKENPEFMYDPHARIEVRPIKMEEKSTGFIYPSKG